MSGSDSENSDAAKLQGPLFVPSLLNSVFFVSPDGTKQIVVGNRAEKDFPVSIRFYQHSKPQTGLEFSQMEWKELVANRFEIRSYLENGQPIQTFLLGSVGRAVDFSRHYGKRSIILTETMPPVGYHPREIVLKELAWNYLESIFPAIDGSLIRASLNSTRAKLIFAKICEHLKPFVAEYKKEEVLRRFERLIFSDVFNNFSPTPMPEDLHIFTQIQLTCAPFIFDHIMEENTGVKVPGGY